MSQDLVDSRRLRATIEAHHFFLRFLNLGDQDLSKTNRFEENKGNYCYQMKNPVELRNTTRRTDAKEIGLFPTILG